MRESESAVLNWACVSANIIRPIERFSALRFASGDYRGLIDQCKAYMYTATVRPILAVICTPGENQRVCTGTANAMSELAVNYCAGINIVKRSIRIRAHAPVLLPI